MEEVELAEEDDDTEPTDEELEGLDVELPDELTSE